MNTQARSLLIICIITLTACARGPYISTQQKGYNRIHDAQSGFQTSLKALHKAKNDADACYALQHSKMYTDTLKNILSETYHIVSNPEGKYKESEQSIYKDILKVAAPAAAETKLTLGDFSLRYDCDGLAEESYNYVFTVFEGKDYIEYKKRARVGLVNLYQKIQQRI